MKLVTILGVLVFGVLVVVGVYMRSLESDPDVWHIDPREVREMPELGRWMLRDGAESDGPAVIVPGTPDDVLARFDEIARGTPRVKTVAGSVAEGHLTYVARSLLFGFPDYVSVVAYPVEAGTALAIYSRVRLGTYDMEVNRRRVERWLSEMG